MNKLNRNKPIRIGKVITVPIGQYKTQPKKEESKKVDPQSDGDRSFRR